jgi:chromosome partitioning protein
MEGSRRAKIIAVATQKGGCGKTTTTSAMAEGLTREGYKVLSVDLDGQKGNLSLAYQADKDTVCGSYELFTAKQGEYEDGDLIQQTASFGDLIAANGMLATAVSGLEREIGRERKLSKVLERLRPKYDYILIDTPGALDIFTVNALAAADRVLVPMIPDYFAAAGAVGIMEVIEKVREDVNPDLGEVYAVFVLYRAQTITHREVEASIRAMQGQLGLTVLDATVRLSVEAQAAQLRRSGLLSSAAASAVAEDYIRVLEELHRREGTVPDTTQRIA